MVFLVWFSCSAPPVIYDGNMFLCLRGLIVCIIKSGLIVDERLNLLIKIGWIVCVTIVSRVQVTPLVLGGFLAHFPSCTVHAQIMQRQQRMPHKLDLPPPRLEN